MAEIINIQSGGSGYESQHVPTDEAGLGKAETTIIKWSTALPDLFPYSIIQVPPHLHQNWIDITYQMTADKLPRDIIQGATLRMLQMWFRSLYPDRKLCNFEEFTPEEVDRASLPIKPGFYLRTRKMTPEELKAALVYEDREKKAAKDETPTIPGVQTGTNPRWELEGKMYHIDELRGTNPQQYLD